MTWDVRVGNALTLLRDMSTESVQCVVTSPPYWGLRNYHGGPDMIGLEPTLGKHLERLVDVFREVRRVLRSDGTVWLNYGDAYQGPPRKSYGTQADNSVRGEASAGWKDADLPSKQRLLLPARVALAFQADGWWIRSEIIWAKGVSFCPTYAGSCMPSSVRDRPTDSHEMVYLLSKSPRYFYDGDAVRERGVTDDRPRSTWNARSASEPMRRGDPGESGHTTSTATLASAAGRNIRTVWTINPQPYLEAHFATFPEALVRPCILAGTSERGACSECGAPWERVVEASGGTIGADWNPRDTSDGAVHKVRAEAMADGTYSRTTTGWRPTCSHDAPIRPCLVLDPFSGSGTTGVVALRLGRDYLGLELSEEYAEMSRHRLRNALHPRSKPLKVEAGQLDLFG